MEQVKYAFVGCSSSNKVTNQLFIESARRLGQFLSNNDYNLVFGASNNGLMGEVYRTMKSNNSKVIGIAPMLYKDDFNSLMCDEEYVTKNAIERINLMVNKSDIIIFLAGGTGTLEELIVILEMKRRKEIDKPIIIFDENEFYIPLIEQLNMMENYNFSQNCNSLFVYVSNMEMLAKQIEGFKEYSKIKVI